MRHFGIQDANRRKDVSSPIFFHLFSLWHFFVLFTVGRGRSYLGRPRTEAISVTVLNVGFLSTLLFFIIFIVFFFNSFSFRAEAIFRLSPWRKCTSRNCWSAHARFISLSLYFLNSFFVLFFLYSSPTQWHTFALFAEKVSTRNIFASEHRTRDEQTGYDGRSLARLGADDARRDERLESTRDIQSQQRTRSLQLVEKRTRPRSPPPREYIPYISMHTIYSI